MVKLSPQPQAPLALGIRIQSIRVIEGCMDTAASESLSNLERLAQGIPSMGGRKNGQLLRKLGSEAPSGTAIVEVGAWLGSGTAHLALGVLDDRNRPTIHCFDQWHASRFEARHAKAQTGIEITIGSDTLPIVRRFLKPFEVAICFHKGRIEHAEWPGSEKISVYVDDASKSPDVFYHILKTFGPHWIPRQTVLVLMDFLHWQKNPGAIECKCQQDFIEAHADCFGPIDYATGTTRAFRYEKRIDFSSLKPFPRPKNLRGFTPAWVRSLARGLYRRFV